MNQSVYPSLYQINTRVWLTDFSRALGRPATLDDIPDRELDQLADMGFDWIWFLSVWTTGEKGRKVSLENQEWRHEFEQTLPDLREEDIGGSGFSIACYVVSPALGGDEALKRLRSRLKRRGLKLMLDFVPNHMGPDHAWVQEHPDYFVSGDETALEKNPQNYFRIKIGQSEQIFAYGRDPYFAGWPDTVQLDYSNPATAEAMKQELIRIAGQCDGVRCDMAMLILPEVFERTWGRKAQPFWLAATTAVRNIYADFSLMAEVYWDMEWTLQQQGFDYTYDKRLYDRLREGHPKPIREHFLAGLDYQNKLARFLENHDEPRAANTFGFDQHKAAAIITYFSPGLRFFHQGQFEGRMKRISPHLVRAPQEPLHSGLQKFYADLLKVVNQPVLRRASWHLLPAVSAWQGNDSWNAFVAFSWEAPHTDRIVTVVNYAPHQSQCYLRLPFGDLSGKQWQFQDLMSDTSYTREGDELQSKGLFLDIPGWHYHVFKLITA